MEIVALEYREGDFGSSEEFRRRLSGVLEGCLSQGLGAVGLTGLLEGRPRPLQGEESPALLLGLRAEGLEFAGVFADELGARGLTGLLTFSKKRNDGGGGEIPDSIWAGMGVVAVAGGEEVLAGQAPGRIREFLQQIGDVRLLMPGVDRDGRGLDGLVLEEARRKGVAMVWTPGSGVNRIEGEDQGGLEVLTARVDEGSEPVEALAGWARGDRIERGKARLKGLRAIADRWI